MKESNEFKKLMESQISELNENVMTGLKDAGFTAGLRHSVLNLGNNSRFNYAEKYDFNNYYTLDIKYPLEPLIDVFKSGRALYEKEFVERIYAPYQMDKYLYKQLYVLYEEKVKEHIRKKKQKELFNKHFNSLLNGEEDLDEIDEVEEELDIQIMAQFEGKTIEEILESGGTIIESLYDELNTVSLWVSEDGNEKRLVIKKRVGNKEGFVDLVMNGLTSAARGTIPLGVTIEEIIHEKFSKKPIMQDKGAYVNKIKDPTSDQPFDFRAMNPSMLKNLHKVILLTFMDSKGVYINQKVDLETSPDESIEDVGFGNMTNDEEKKLGIVSKRTDVKRGTLIKPRYSNLVLYLTQDDFKILEGSTKNFINKFRKFIVSMSDAINR